MLPVSSPSCSLALLASSIDMFAFQGVNLSLVCWQAKLMRTKTHPYLDRNSPGSVAASGHVLQCLLVT